MRGRSTASCSVSLRFFSPPDRSTLSERWSSALLEADARRLGSRAGRRARRWRHRAPSSASRIMSSRATPGTSVGYCITRCRPAAARSHVGMRQHVDAVERDGAGEHLVAGLAHHDRRERALAGAVRAHHGVRPRRSTRSGRCRGGSPCRRRRRAGRGSRSVRHRRAPRPGLDGDDAVDDSDREHRHRLGGRQRLRLAGDEAERAAVLRALDLALVAPHLALGQRHVGVAADVADRVDVVADAHDRDRRRRRRRPGARRARLQVGRAANVVSVITPTPGQRARRGRAWPTTRRRSSAASGPTGSWSSTSSKKPSTIRRSAICVGMPRLSR